MEVLVKPFVKWAGGKFKLADTILEHLSTHLDLNEFDTYVDPFVGGGGMLFALMNKYKFNRVIISDVNAELINTYKVIQNDLCKLIEELDTIQNHFNSLLDDNSKKLYFYDLRAEFNDNIQNQRLNVRQAALFIGLNKLSFNGLYRVNSKGLYNVPFGQKKRIKIYEEGNLYAVSEVLQKAEIYQRDFAECVNDITKTSLVYFDSPYRPLPGSSSFTSYAKSTFNDEEQIRLAAIAKEVTNSGGTFFLSNSDPTQIDKNDLFFDNLYKPFEIRRIEAKRMISATSRGRGVISELLIIGKSDGGTNE